MKRKLDTYSASLADKAERLFASHGSWYPSRRWLRRLRDTDREFSERWLAGTWFHPLFWVRRSLRSRVREASVEISGLLLDAGAGGCPYHELLAQQARVVVALDLEPSFKRGAPLIEVAGDVAALPFRESTFDAVLCTEVLEHVIDPASVIAELARVTRAEGTVICTVPFAFPLHDVNDYRRLTACGLRRLFEDGGFEVLRSKPVCGSGRTVAMLLNLYLFDLGCYWTSWLYVLSLPLRPLIWVFTAALNLLGGGADLLCPSTHLAFGHIIVARNRPRPTL